LRIINTPQRGIGVASVEKLLARAVRAGKSIWDILPGAEAAGELPNRALAALSEFRALLRRYSGAFDDPSTSLPELFDRLIAEIDYRSEIERHYDEPEQQLARMGAIEQLREAMRIYEERAESPRLADFLDDCALVGRDEEQDAEEATTADAVKLMTLHSAKGLEFPRVYLVGLEEGLLPHRRSLEDEENSISEERRLAYVGVTRAMTDLTISWASSRMKWGKRRPSIVSRFIHEMRSEGEECS
jgi:DNA helicase II / ATP-dependent DNA helicase PcrA